MELVSKFFSTARERYTIKLLREAGEPPPWTKDKVFQAWRFCNVHREDDRTTVWFRENVRSKLSGLDVVEATTIFRWFNKIETGQAVLELLQNGWDIDEALRRVDGLKPVVTGAYMIATPPGYSKIEGIFRAFETARPMLATMTWGSLQEAHGQLITIPYLGKFTAGQIVIDLRHTPVLNHAPDINTWTVAGPGCARGLGRVVGNDPTLFKYGSDVDQKQMLEVMIELLAKSKEERYWPQAWEPWELHECEAWSCEFDKHQRASAGDRMKRRFP